VSNTRKCVKCRQELPIDNFIASSSPFLPAHRSYICTSCLERMAAATDLDAVDALCRHLDIPFNPDEWTRLYDIHGEHTLTAYADFLSSTPYSTMGWKEETARWADLRQKGEEQAAIEKFAKEAKKELYKRWSPDYTYEELLWLDEYYKKVLGSQNVSTPILEEYAKDLCEVELQIKKGLRQGLDVKKLMDARDNIVKMANFTANNSKNASAFESIGELLMYYGKKGFKPTYHVEPKDSVDFIIENQQAYLRRLVMNEGNIAEQVDEKRDAYNLSKRLEDSTDDWRRYENAAENVEYEGEGALITEIESGDAL
jgi:hypothetical protein